MSTWVVNIDTGAATRYQDYEFNSFCQGADGKYYGVKDDGLYLLEGESPDVFVDFGRLTLGTEYLKHIINVYAACASEAPLTVTVSGYSYNARSSDTTMKDQRFDLGKGLRVTYFEPVLTSNGGAMMLDSLDIAAKPTTRRI